MRLLNKNSKRFIVNLFSDFILSKIDKLEKSKISIQTHQRIKELYFPFVFFALLVFVILFLIKNTLLRTTI